MHDRRMSDSKQIVAIVLHLARQCPMTNPTPFVGSNSCLEQWHGQNYFRGCLLWCANSKIRKAVEKLLLTVSGQALSAVKRSFMMFNMEQPPFLAQRIRLSMPAQMIDWNSNKQNRRDWNKNITSMKPISIQAKMQAQEDREKSLDWSGLESKWTRVQRRRDNQEFMTCVLSDHPSGTFPVVHKIMW